MPNRMPTLTESLWGSLLIAQVVKAARGAESEHKARKAVEQVVREAYSPTDGCPECGPGAPGWVDDPQGPAGDPASVVPCSVCHAASFATDGRVDPNESQREWTVRVADLRRMP